VNEAAPDIIWGDSEQKVGFPGELAKRLDRRDKGFKRQLVHLDLDVLDESEGKVNGYESPRGLSAEELVECFELIPQKATPASLTVNPNLGHGDKIAGIGVKAILDFVKGMIEEGLLTTH
jgi:arginase